MTAFEELQREIESLKYCLDQIRMIKGEIQIADKSLQTAVIGHRAWDSHGLKEISNPELHRAAIAAVSGKLIADMEIRQAAKLRNLADGLDVFRGRIPKLASEAAFELADNALAARTWKYERTET